jgi:tetratricopeptide (TPR) repeat protein
MRRILAVSIFGVALACSSGPACARLAVSPGCDTSKPQTAIADCTEVIQKREAPADVLANAYFIRGVTWLSSSDYAKAEADLDEAIKLNGAVTEYHRARGFVRGVQSKAAGAVEDLDIVLKANPKDGWSLVLRGGSKDNLGDPDGAIVDFNAALQLNPKDILAYIDRGVAYRNKRDAARALADDDAAIAIDPNFPGGYGARCLTRAVFSVDLDKALADCDRALQLNPKNYFDVATKAFVHLRLKQYEAAIADATASLAMKPNNGNALAIRSMAERALGRRAQADADLAAAHKIDPELDSVMKNWRLEPGA